MIATATHQISTCGQGDTRDITALVSAALAGSCLQAGIVTAFVTGSTAGITIVEFEPGVVHDIARTFDRLAPRHAEYRHHLKEGGDDNGSSHVRAALVGPSLTVPFLEGALRLGQWQQIALLEFDTRPRTREIVIHILGE